MLRPPRVRRGHVAAWIGVGGYGLGPKETDEWLQAGISVRPGQAPALYYEVALPNREPRFVMLHGHFPIGRTVRVAVLESSRRANWWEVWVNGTIVARQIHLPQGHGAWRPVATAESWSDIGSACNAFAFRFDNVVTPSAPRGSWRPLAGSILEDPGYRLVRRGSTLVARSS